MSCERVVAHALPAGDEVQAVFHLHLDPVPRLVAAAREFVAEHAPPLPAETQEALLLLTSELVTNAVLHARTPLEVGIAIADDSVLVTVFDHDLARATQQPYSRREGGWGLGLVSALAAESALEPHAEGGKTAWFRLPRGDLPTLQDAVAARPESSQRGGAA